MHYQNSQAHIDNLNKARKLIGIVKGNCSYCDVERQRKGMKRHEESCYLNPLNLKPCIVCDKPIKNWKEGTTCGYACSNKHFRTGENHGNWNEDAYRSTCFLYHEKKCVVCEEVNVIEVHHLDENHENNSPGNLIPLCPTHHQYWHSRFKPLVEAQILEYVTNWSGKD